MKKEVRMSKIDWKRVESDALMNAKEGCYVTRVLPEALIDIFAGIELPAKRLLMYILVSDGLAEKHRMPLSTKGLEVFLKHDLSEKKNKVAFGILLKDNRFEDIFKLFAEEVSLRIKTVSTEIIALDMFSGLISKWQIFMTRSNELISREEYEGLWGELTFLEKVLIPGIGAQAVSSWKGPLGFAQDFEFQGKYLEVKTTARGQYGSIRISNENQLETVNDCPLFLSVVHIVENESGESLPAIVSRMKDKLKEHPESWELFDNLLIQTGYREAHAEQYSKTKFSLQCIRYYQIDENFPSLTALNIPAGIENVSYSLRLQDIENFSISSELLAIRETK
jgi:hypothetical protein